MLLNKSVYEGDGLHGRALTASSR